MKNMYQPVQVMSDLIIYALPDEIYVWPDAGGYNHMRLSLLVVYKSSRPSTSGQIIRIFPRSTILPFHMCTNYISTPTACMVMQ